jgi:nucleotide-binding universal stress UspA family protein
MIAMPLHHEDTMYKHILVPVEGTRLSLTALDAAAGLAKPLGAKVTVLTVKPNYPLTVMGEGYLLDLNSPVEWEKSADASAQKLKHAAEKRAARKGLDIDFIATTHDQPFEAIIKTAEKKKCDLIVMASHGRRGVAALLLGSETTKVLTHSKVPVLVCR